MTTRSFRINAPIRISSLWGNLEENGRVCLGRLGVSQSIFAFHLSGVDARYGYTADGSFRLCTGQCAVYCICIVSECLC